MTEFKCRVCKAITEFGAPIQTGIAAVDVDEEILSSACAVHRDQVAAAIAAGKDKIDLVQIIDFTIRQDGEFTLWLHKNRVFFLSVLPYKHLRCL